MAGHTRRPLESVALAAKGPSASASFDVSRGAINAKPSVELLGSGGTRELGVFSECGLQQTCLRMGGELAENANSSGPLSEQLNQRISLPGSSDVSLCVCVCACHN